MDTKTTTTSTKPAKEFREMAEKGTKQAKETYEKMSAAAAEATDFIKNSYATAVKGMHDYNSKCIEFTHANTNAAFDYFQKLSGVTSPSEYVELSTEHARNQIEALTEQAKQLAALAQKGALATAEPLQTGAAKVFKTAA